jgi:hypothetical protein
MSNFTITHPSLGWQPIASSETVQNHPLGTIVQAVDRASSAYGAGEFIYLKGVASTAVGSVVVYNPDDFSTALAAANAIGPVATAMAANVANQFGWYQISGKGVAKALAGFVDNADCYLTATAGSIDDADVAGDYISGMKGASAIDVPGSGLAEVEMWRPLVRDGLDN